ncbi:hypothetical protein [Nonomuraea sp. NPDC050643]|uniref:hypothetical protein n=1 Tax=Nonomuraea sp. NPDC050643 TaxID=3155660 RepID=UPI0033E9FDA2
MATPETDENVAPSVGRRENVLREADRNFGGSDYEYDGIQAEYVEHAREYDKGNYPHEGPKAPPESDREELIAANRVDPGAAKKEMFIEVGAYEDASGKPLPTSPVEILRQDLRRLQGEGGRSLKVLLDLAGVSDKDLGAWQAAADLHQTTTRAQNTLGTAIGRVYSTYEAVVQALDDTVKTAKGADRAVADKVGKRT